MSLATHCNTSRRFQTTEPRLQLRRHHVQIVGTHARTVQALPDDEAPATEAGNLCDGGVHPSASASIEHSKPTRARTTQKTSSTRLSLPSGQLARATDLPDRPASYAPGSAAPP